MIKFLLVLSLWPLTVLSDGLSLAHTVEVPEIYRNGRTTEAFEGTSDIERYVATHERTWWKVIRNFVETHTRWDMPDLYICSGWPSEVDACNDAYVSATNVLKSLIAEYGSEEVRKYAKEQLNEKI